MEFSKHLNISGRYTPIVTFGLVHLLLERHESEFDS